jgi:hypothetical protein
VVTPLFAVTGPHRLGVGYRHRGPVDHRHQQTPPAHGVVRRGGGRAAQQIEQRPQRRGPEPLPGFAQRARGRLGQAQPAQTGGQFLPYQGVAEFGEQATRQDQVHRHPGREQPDPLLGTAGHGEDLIDHLEGYELGQLTQMAGCEHTRGYPHRPGYGNLIDQSGVPGLEAVLE